MKYENGKEYKFQFEKVTVFATFEGLSDKVADKFNRLCAEERARAYRQEGANGYVGQRAHAGTY